MTQTALVDQAQQPESIALDYYNYQVVLADRTLAHITHDPSDFVTQPWVVEINDEEVHRATTVAKCENWVKWHYKQSTLPVHNEWLTAREEFLDHIEEQADAIALEPAELPVTEVKVARQLEIGDKVVIDGEIWRIERINRQFVQYQVWHSEVHGIRFHLTLLPNAYQYRPDKGEPTNWESARQHEFAESDRDVDTAKYLYPYSEARFDVVVKAIAKRVTRSADRAPQEQSVAQSELLEYMEDQSNAIAPEPSRLVNAAKQLVPVVFGLVGSAQIAAASSAPSSLTQRLRYRRTAT